MIRIERAWIPDIVRSAFQPIIFPKTEGEGKFLINTEAEVSILSPEFQEIFTRFQESKLCGVFIDQIARVKYEPQLAGYLFELLSYFFLESIFRPDEFLLSPEDTHNLFKKVRMANFKTTPDGILFRREEGCTRISAFFEYKVDKLFWERSNHQLNYYQERSDFYKFVQFGQALDHALLSGQKFLPKGFPKNLLWEAPSKFRVVYVVPYNSSLNLNSIEVLHFPITYQEFGHLLNALLLDFGRKK